MRERPRGERAGRFGRRLAWILVGAALASILGFVIWAGVETPTAQLQGTVDVLGKETPIALTVLAGRTGLARVEVLLRDAGGRAVSLAAEDVPRSGLLGSGVRSLSLDVEARPEAAGFAEGPATLEVWARDYGPLSVWRGPVQALAQPVEIDLTPPRLAVLGTQHYVNRGGSDSVLYEVDESADSSGVSVGDYFFPGVSLSDAPPGTHLAVYAIPHDVAPEILPQVMARDRAGNTRTVRFPVQRRERSFPNEEIVLTDDFLQRKVPDLLRENQFPVPADLVEGYLIVNRDLRRRSEERLRELTANSALEPLFEQGFLQQPGTQVRSAFAESRTYRYRGAVIDQQTHLGYDLASTKQAPVAAANDGVVVFVGSLGIYGEAILIDHGLGLFSLYAHLSSSAVSAGDRVARGQTIGRTGETGLAGGDHLHFSILLRGVHVDPIEWWDARWIRHHLHDPIAEVRRAAVQKPAATGASADPPPAPSPAMGSAP